MPIQIRKIIKPIDANTAFHNYKDAIEYTEIVYTQAELEAARQEERERCIEIVENDCTSLADQHFIIKAIRKMGEE